MRSRPTPDAARREALGALFDAQAPGLFAFALQLTGDAARAEDLVGTAFLRFVERGEREVADPGPWLRKVLHNAARDEARRRRGSEPVPAGLPADAPDPGELAEAAEAADRLLAALERLPEPYRGVLELRLREGLAPAEIAARRGTSAGTVRMQQSRALARLRELLPVSLAGAAALELSTGRGLARVRTSVTAPAVPPAALLAALPFGALSMKTAAALVVSLLALVLGFVSWRDAGGSAATPDEAPGAAPALSQLSLEAPADRAGAVSGQRRSAPGAAETVEPPADLAAVWGEPGSLDVRVLLRGAPWPGQHAALTHELGGRAVPMRRGMSDAAGALRFDAIPPGPYRLEVAGCPSRWFDVEPGESVEILHDVRFPVELELRVVDSAGAAVEGALVEGWRNGAWFERGRSGEGGALRLLTGVAEDGEEFRARQPGSQPGERREWLGEARAFRTLELVAPAGLLSAAVEVRDASGAPLASGLLRVDRVPWPDHVESPIDATGPAGKIDSDTLASLRVEGGTASVEGLPPGVYRFIAGAPGHGCAAAIVTVEPGASAVELVQLALPAAACVRLSVVDEAGAPVPHAQFIARMEEAWNAPRLQADAEGRIELRDLQPGTLKLLPPPSARDDQPFRIEAEFELQPGELRDAVVVARHVPRLRGLVLQENDLPLVGAPVYGCSMFGAVKVGERVGVFTHRTTTDAQGRFRMDPDGDRVRDLAIASPTTGTVLALVEDLVPGEERIVRVPDQQHLSWSVDVEAPTVDGAAPALPFVQVIDGDGNGLLSVRFDEPVQRLDLTTPGPVRLRFGAQEAVMESTEPIEAQAGAIQRIPGPDLTRGGYLELALPAEVKADPQASLGEYWMFVTEPGGPITEYYNEGIEEDLLSRPLPPGDVLVRLETERGVAERTVRVVAGEVTRVELGLE